MTDLALIIVLIWLAILLLAFASNSSIKVIEKRLDKIEKRLKMEADA